MQLDTTVVVPSLFAGLTQTLVGQPFDTCKTFIILKKPIPFRPSVLYRGSFYPFLSGISTNTVSFSVTTQLVGTGVNPFVAGLVAGITISPIVTLLDSRKILRQIGEPKRAVNLRKTYPLYLAKESLAMSLYFGSYHTMTFHPLVSGAISGVLNWSVTFPLDVLRTRSVMGYSLRESLQKGGLYKGIGLCCARALVVNACIFQAHDYVSSLC